MLYLYDTAISEDLKRSFDPENMGTSMVTLCNGEELFGILAAIQEDHVKLPVVGLTRDESLSADESRMNFSRLHQGVVSVMDPKTNMLYHEQAIPVKLGYTLTVLTSNTADRDELVRELIFKYVKMYFLSITLPYEAKRKVRFGVIFDHESEVDYKSAAAEYTQTGQLYQAMIHLKCDGCVMVNYTPVKLIRTATEMVVEDHSTH